MDYLLALDDTVRVYSDYLRQRTHPGDTLEAHVLASVVLGIRLHQHAPSFCHYSLTQLERLAAKVGLQNEPDEVATLMARAIALYLRQRPREWSEAEVAALVRSLGEE